MSQVACPRCGHLNRPGARFCSRCAAPLAPAVPIRGLGTGRLPLNFMLQNRYIIVRRIGQGGMAAVYQATDSRLSGQMWAVKEMSDVAIKDPAERRQAIQSFLREAQMLAQLSHPNLPRVTDSFTEAGKHYLVMEYIPGETLEDKVTRQGGPLPEARVLNWAAQLCDVLTYLHSCRPPIIFRDLKPSNVMVTPNNAVKLIDFGIVRLFKPGKQKDTVHMGTPGYTPPEQFGTAQTDARSDIYALGATLHRLLTGFDPTSVSFQLPSLRSVNPKVSPRAAKVVERALELNPNDRWPSAAEMRTALIGSRQVVPPPVAPPVSPFPRLPKPAPARTSRPTTRLIMAAAQLSDKQLAWGLGGILLFVVLGIWFLAPVVEGVPFIWDNFPLLALVGPLAYAATRRRWAAGLAHATVAVIGALTLWARLGYAASSVGTLVTGAAFSGLCVEGWVWLLPRVKGSGDPDAWKREGAWLAVMGTVGVTVLNAVVVSLNYALTVGPWIGGTLLGAAGWFLGDLVQEFFYYQQTGLRRPR